MNLKIEQELSKFKTHIIDYASLKSVLICMGYLNINKKINNLKQKGIIRPLKKGLYIHTSVINKNIISKNIISNVLLGSPSYISLDYALSFHGLIPESVYEITAITTSRSKKYNTDFGIFSYKHIKKELFPVGLKIESTQQGNFLIASKEKAVCDKIYFTKDANLSSKQKMSIFFKDDLRINIDDLRNCNRKVISDYYNISKSKKIKILLNLIKEL